MTWLASWPNFLREALRRLIRTNGEHRCAIVGQGRLEITQRAVSIGERMRREVVGVVTRALQALHVNFPEAHRIAVHYGVDPAVLQRRCQAFDRRRPVGGAGRKVA